MSDPTPKPAVPNYPLGPTSEDSPVYVIEGGEDTTERPCRPSLLPLMQAAREREEQWRKRREQQPPPEPPPATENAP